MGPKWPTQLLSYLSSLDIGPKSKTKKIVTQNIPLDHTPDPQATVYITEFRSFEGFWRSAIGILDIWSRYFVINPYHLFILARIRDLWLPLWKRLRSVFPGLWTGWTSESWEFFLKQNGRQMCSFGSDHQAFWKIASFFLGFQRPSRVWRYDCTQKPTQKTFFSAGMTGKLGS